MVMAIAVAASLLAEIRFGVVRVPVIIWEIAFGILIGPHGLGLATAGASLEFLENSGLVALFFMWREWSSTSSGSRAGPCRWPFAAGSCRLAWGWRQPAFS